MKRLLICLVLGGCYAPTDHTHDGVDSVCVKFNSTVWDGIYYCYEDFTDAEFECATPSRA